MVQGCPGRVEGHDQARDRVPLQGGPPRYPGRPAAAQAHGPMAAMAVASPSSGSLLRSQPRPARPELGRSPTAPAGAGRALTEHRRRLRPALRASASARRGPASSRRSASRLSPGRTGGYTAAARQHPFDLGRICPNREHQRLRALHGPPARTRPRDTGRGPTHAPIGKVPPPTKTATQGTSSPTSSANTMAETSHLMSTQGAAQHPRQARRSLHAYKIDRHRYTVRDQDGVLMICKPSRQGHRAAAAPSKS